MFQVRVNEHKPEIFMVSCRGTFQRLSLDLPRQHQLEDDKDEPVSLLPSTTSVDSCQTPLISSDLTPELAMHLQEAAMAAASQKVSSSTQSTHARYIWPMS